MPVIPREKDASLGCWGEAPGHSGQAAQQDEGRTTVAPMESGTAPRDLGRVVFTPNQAGEQAPRAHKLENNRSHLWVP